MFFSFSFQFDLLTQLGYPMAAVGLGGPPDPRPLPFFDLRPRLGQLVEVRPKLLKFDGVPPPMTFMGHRHP